MDRRNHRGIQKREKEKVSYTLGHFRSPRMRSKPLASIFSIFAGSYVPVLFLLDDLLRRWSKLKRTKARFGQRALTRGTARSLAQHREFYSRWTSASACRMRLSVVCVRYSDLCIPALEYVCVCAVRNNFACVCDLCVYNSRMRVCAYYTNSICM